MSSDETKEPRYVIYKVNQTPTMGIESSTYGGVFEALSHLVTEHKMAMEMSARIDCDITGFSVNVSGDGLKVDVHRTYRTRVGMMSLSDVAEKATEFKEMFVEGKAEASDAVLKAAKGDNDFDFVSELFDRAFRKNLGESARKAIKEVSEMNPTEREKRLKQILTDIDNFGPD